MIDDITGIGILFVVLAIVVAILWIGIKITLSLIEE